MDINQLKKEARQKLKKASNLKEIEKVEQEILGKKGALRDILKSLSDKSLAQRKKIGQDANVFKQNFTKELKKKKAVLKEQHWSRKKKEEKLDLTQPGQKLKTGHLHPLTQVLRETEDIFKSLGFGVVEGPEVDNEYYNFDALNIPAGHPSRDEWDTLWVKSKEGDKLLRTHTSPVQIHFMENNKPPFRIIAPGRVYRHEDTNKSHGFQFYQIEGLMIGEDISVANFKALIQEFFNQFFGRSVEMRMRTGYFPFTEPSFEIDIKSKDGEWLELVGAGMVHPHLYKSVGYEERKWQGFAFGIGLDRLTMLKYGIDDLRLLYNSDLRFIKQF